MARAFDIREHAPLAPLTTLGVGGPARYLAEVNSVAGLREAVAWAEAGGLPLFLLGGGSNLVVSDSGFPGLVIRMALRGVEREDGVFRAYAGEDWDGLVARSVDAGCAGIECLSGIPGTVGGTPVQNVGAYGQEVSETITSVEALDLHTRELVCFAGTECGFAYRQSRFNTADRGRYVIVRVTYQLRPGGAPKVAYRDLQEHFAKELAGDTGRTPTLPEVREAVRAVRQSKAMLLVEGDEDARSAGSFFKNPILTGEDYARLQAVAEARGVRVPSYPAELPRLGQGGAAGQPRYKVPAAWLVEQSGFHKGYQCGPVGISRKHALAIVNRGGATAADVIALKDRIQAGVRDAFGLDLHPEPVFVGFREGLIK